MEYLGKVKFGRILHKGNPLKRPHKPWTPDSYPAGFSQYGLGDTNKLSRIAKEYSFGNSDAVDEYTILWHKFKDDNKYIYISDRVWLADFHYSELLNSGILDVEVTIDNQTFKSTTLNGGTYATDPTSEWRKIIMNEANIAGLPTPNESDLGNMSSTQQPDTHNQFWNWWGISTMLKPISTSTAVYTGFSSVGKWDTTGFETSKNYFGWRPVLEQEIPIDPPGKPIPLYPTSEDKTHPEPIKGEIILQTKYNGDGSLEQMDVSVYNYTQQKFEYQSEWIDNTTGIMQLPVTFKASNNYKITVRHKGTGGIGTEWLELYVIGGVLGKYKLSESVTAGQFKPVSVYGQTQNLVMKPQIFPETKGSKVRLVPEVMNKITVASVSGNDLVFADSTKTPTIGDKLIKDNQIYNITNITGTLKYTSYDNNLLVNTANYFLGNAEGNSVIKYKDNIFFLVADIKNSKVQLIRTDLSGEHYTLVFYQNSLLVQDLGITQLDNFCYIYMLEKSTSQMKYRRVNLDTLSVDPEQSGYGFGETWLSVSAVAIKATQRIALAIKRKNSDGTCDICFRTFPLDNLSSIGTLNVFNKTEENLLSYPVIVNIENKTNYSSEQAVFQYVCVENGHLYLNSYRWSGIVAPDQEITLATIPYTDLKLSVTMSQINGDWYRMVTVVGHNADTNQYAIFFRVFDKSLHELAISTLYFPEKITGAKMTASTKGDIRVVYSTESKIANRKTTLEHLDTWSDEITIKDNETLKQGQIFDLVDYGATYYGNYPAILMIRTPPSYEYMTFLVEYTLEDVVANQITLDKSVTSDMGEVIKYYDYDIEVQAGEEKAVVKPNLVTDEYYEYDAQFNSKKSERDITIRGRNTKLTTLYYYNY